MEEQQESSEHLVLENVDETILDEPLTYAEVMQRWESLFAIFPKLRLPVVDDKLYYFDPLTADEKIAFFEQQLHHVEGPQAHENLILEPWQRYVIAMTYAWKQKTFDDNGEWIKTTEQLDSDLRKFREVFIFIPRKNGKSFLGAGFALEGLFADNEQGARVISAAADREQAALIFDVAKQIVEENEFLLKDAEPFRRTIIVPRTASNYKVVSADVKTKHGKNLSHIIIDELHAQPNRDLTDVLFTSVGARLQPLKVMATTAGHDRNSICYEYYDYAKKVAAGILVDEQFFPVIFEPDEGDDWKEESTWLKANPNLGVSITWDYFRGEFKKALAKPSYENTFKRLHLNMWTQQDVRWVPVEEWDGCGETFDPRILLGKECWGGVDLASKKDLCAYSLIFPIDEIFYILSWFWVPQDNIPTRKTRDRVDYDVWARQGHIIATPGNTVDYSKIRSVIEETRRLYQVKTVGFDEWNAQDTMTMLEASGLDVVKVPQIPKYLSDPTKEFEAKILSRRIRHNNNPVLRWMFGNLAAIEDSNGNIRFCKKRSKEKIDGMVSIINGLSRYLMAKKDADSVYKTRGIRVIG